MKQELLFFIITSGALIVGVLIDSWQDKEIMNDFHRGDCNFNTLMHKWKFWGNANKLYDITVIDLVLIIVTGWWWAIFWLPIHWWLWWMMHDLSTGWFILGKPLHISSDKISQYFGRIFQQSGLFMLGWRLLWLFLLTMGYLTLSFGITLW